jgi:cell division septal protein FtsQ
VAAVLIGAWYAGPTWRIGEVTVVNNAGIPSDQIIGTSGVQGEHYQFVDLQAAAARVDDLPGVEAAEVRCRWFGGATCTIAVLPAPALALWQASDESVWNDTEGKVQRAMQPVDARLRIAVQDGDLPPLGTDLEPPLLQMLVEMAEIEPPLRQLIWSAEYGLMYDDPTGIRVRLGVTDRIGGVREKMQLARKLADTLATRGLQVRVIDVRFDAAPFYSL